MKDENKNIDAFFSARLQNETVGDDEWNIPSDDIWNIAKPKFIDRKKPKRRFFFWLLIPILALCISLPLKVIEGEEVAPHSTLIEKNGGNSTTEIVQDDVKEVNSSLEFKEDISKTSFTSKENSSVSKKQPIQSRLQKKQSNSQFAQPSETKDFNPNISNHSKIESITEQSYNIENIEVDNTLFIKEEESIPSARQKLIIPFLNNANNSNTLKKAIASNSKQEKLEYPNEIEVENKSLIIPFVAPVYRREIGISHSELLINLALVFDIQSDNGVDEYKLSNNYFNANITGRRWINRKWSFMTGAQYSDLEIDFNFSVLDTLDTELAQFLNEEVNYLRSRSSFSNDDENVLVEIKDGVVTQLGDALNIKGDINLEIKAVQIPFFLDYHIYKPRFEYIFGMGASLEYVEVSQLTSNLEVYKSNQLITKPITIPEYNDSYIDGSIYIKSGMRYKISDRFNLGLDAKISLLDLPFSGIDAGFYYRWN